MNLLTDPVFRIETADGLQHVSLPALLTALGTDQVESLSDLQRHQEDAIRIFLCQLAASVLVREKRTDPNQNEDFWREGIRRTTGRDDDCAWTLVVEDLTKPAFMQPSIPRNNFGRLRTVACTPDEIDILPTAKNHDVKTARSNTGFPGEWVFALISLQTTAGFFGRGNYGIARMNGGFASRPCVELQASQRQGKRWTRSVSRLLKYRNSLLLPPWPYRSDGHLLLWTLSWDGESSLSLSSLDPFFIEIARIVRLSVLDNRSIAAVGMPANTSRTSATNQKGVLGDPWTPVNTSGQGMTALTVSATGLTPNLLHKIIFCDGIMPAFMQQVAPDERGQSMVFYASVLVRGQGKTDGFHAVHIPIPPTVGFVLFGEKDGKNRLQETSRRWLNDARSIQNKVLKFALFTLLEGGPKKVNFDKPEIGAWVDKTAKAFSQSWSYDYFDWLWRSLGYQDEDCARLAWLESLETKARRVLNEAMEKLPQRHGRRLRARVKARGHYFGALNKHFPELKEARDARRTA